MNDSLEEHKIALAFLVRKHKALQNKYLEMCRTKAELDTLKNKTELFKIMAENGRMDGNIALGNFNRFLLRS